MPPEADILTRIAEIETRVGPLPLSLCAWYELVGSVDFMVPDADEAQNYEKGSDPLVILPAKWTLKYGEDHWWRERYGLDMAPDFYHKDRISGGNPYTIYLPNADADTPLYYAPQGKSFVHYLRTDFLAGGFPGREADSFVQELAANLLPI